MSPTQWAELGIPPTDDERAIKRAYALRLKGLDLQADPAGFQRLRAAFETALRGLRRAPPPPEPPRAAPVARPDPADEAVAEVQRLLAAGELAGALDLMAAAEAGGRLSFGAAEELQLGFLLRAADPAPLPEDLLLRMAARFEWRQALHPLRRRQPSAFASLDARLDAEQWFSELRATAARRGWRRRDRTVARVLLRGRPGWRDRLFASAVPGLDRRAIRRALAVELDRFDRHSLWIGERFEPSRIAWCRRQTKRPRWIAWAVLTPFTLLLLVPLVTDPNVQSAVTAITWFALLAIPLLVRWFRQRRAARRRAG